MAKQDIKIRNMTARNIVGDTTGTAVPSGIVGERITSVVTNSSASASGSGLANTTVRTITLNKGLYYAAGYVGLSGFSGNAGRVTATVNAGTNSPTVFGRTSGQIYVNANMPVSVSASGLILVTADSSTITIKVEADNSTMGSTVTFSSEFDAVRIA